MNKWNLKLKSTIPFTLAVRTYLKIIHKNKLKGSIKENYKNLQLNTKQYSNEGNQDKYIFHIEDNKMAISTPYKVITLILDI